MDLAILAGDLARAVDQDRGVKAMHRIAPPFDLSKAHIKADAEPLRRVEERHRLRAGHLPLKKAVDLLLVRHPPAREEGGERQLGEDHEVAFVLGRQPHELEHALDRADPAVPALDRPQLRRA